MKFGSDTNGIDVVKNFASQVKGKIFLITGPSTGGIGGETAISLAHGAPAMLVLLGRSRDKARPVIDAVAAVAPSVQVKFVEADLSSLASVRRGVEAILADPEIPRVDALINNAAIMMSPFALTEDGIEQQLATDHVGHFLLTNLLLPKLLPEGAAADRRVRVVNVSSSGNRMGPIRWEDPNFALEGSYTPILGYGQAKRANVLFSVALNARLGGRNLRSYALHPGNIITNLGKFLTPEMMREAAAIIMGDDTAEFELKTLQQGCATQLRAALDPDLEREGDGVFLADCVLTDDPTLLDPESVNAADAERLWSWSEKLVGQTFSY